MSSALNTLKAIDALIYKPYLTKLNKIVEKAYQLNESKPVKYLFFNSLDNMRGAYIPPTKAIAKEYLDGFVDELAPIINERAIINAYLLRFINQVPSFSFFLVFYLLPEQYHKDIPPLEEGMALLVAQFREMPEFNLIKKRLFLGAIYGS
jgi:hypothetical protein